MKLTLEDFEENELFPVGLRSSQEAHRLAYLLNHYLAAGFTRKPKDVTGNEGVFFEHFEWINPTNDTVCHLIANHCWITPKPAKNSSDLLEFSTSKKVSLVPEFEMLDFFIVQEDWDYHPDIKQAIQSIPEIELFQTISNAKQRRLFNFVLT